MRRGEDARRDQPTVGCHRTRKPNRSRKFALHQHGGIRTGRRVLRVRRCPFRGAEGLRIRGDFCRRRFLLSHGRRKDHLRVEAARDRPAVVGGRRKTPRLHRRERRIDEFLIGVFQRPRLRDATGFIDDQTHRHDSTPAGFQGVHRIDRRRPLAQKRRPIGLQFRFGWCGGFRRTDNGRRRHREHPGNARGREPEKTIKTKTDKRSRGVHGVKFRRNRTGRSPRRKGSCVSALRTRRFSSYRSGLAMRRTDGERVLHLHGEQLAADRAANPQCVAPLRGQNGRISVFV